MSPADHLAAFDALAFRSRIKIVWAFCWRAVIVTLASTIGGGIAGFLVGALLGIGASMLSYSVSSDAFKHTAQVFGGLAGAVVGVFAVWQYIRWLLSANLGGYRLRLVPHESDAV
jgi:hypothetical protein